MTNHTGAILCFYDDLRSIDDLPFDVECALSEGTLESTARINDTTFQNENLKTLEHQNVCVS